MGHPLHEAVAKGIRAHLPPGAMLLCDSACGGDHQQLPLFIGRRKARDTRMCCVDLLVVRSRKIRVIVEIEESGFEPMKICGKFFQAALADRFIHDGRPRLAMPYADKVLFLQVLDGSKGREAPSSKEKQAARITRRIQRMLPLRKITSYRLALVKGPSHSAAIDSLGKAVALATGSSA